PTAAMWSYPRSLHDALPIFAKGGEGGRGERLELVAALVEATIDPDAVLTRHERWGTRAVKCVELRSVLSPDLDHVLEAAVRDQHDAGAAALEQRVRRDRRSVNQQCCVAPGTQRLEGSVHGARRILRRRGHLRDAQRAVGHCDGIRERAARIDSDDD